MERRLGSQVREVTLWAWLTFRPVTVALPQISHFLAISKLLTPERGWRSAKPGHSMRRWNLAQRIPVAS
jgi:hypothetical protein